MSRYDVNSANTNRIVRFRVEAKNAADQSVGLFDALKGAANSYPYYGQVAGVPTGAQEVAQLRMSLVARALSAYAVLVGVQVADDSAATGNTSAVILTFETDENGVFFNNAWPNNTGLDKHLVTDIVDTVGTGGMPFGAKTKDGLQSLLDGLSVVSYDGGTTGPFGDLSGTTAGTGDLTMPDGTVVTGILPLDNAGGGTGDAGLTVTLLAQ